MDYSELTLKIGAKLYEESKAWEHTRYLAAIILNVNRNPKKPAIKPEKLIRLPTDKRQKSAGNGFDALVKMAKHGTNNR